MSVRKFKEIQNEQILRSAIASARIEGNPYTFESWNREHLSPRREEILAIITDHPNCSFDFLARRFPSLNPKTLHYDLLQLQKKGILKKLGTTRAVVYRAP